MEEIKVGEYCRTKKGIIFQAKDNVTINENIPKKYKKLVDDVVKHSKNIIDLIEVGDIVNNYKILDMVDLKNSDKKVFTICKSDFKNICRVWGNEDIETILTHQQYENNCYRIGE